MSVSTPNEKQDEKKQESLGELIVVVIQALLIALVVRTFLFQPFNIPSGSMKSTLLVGDYVFVSKFSYGYSKFSLVYPFTSLPFSGRFWEGKPERGDVAVFRLPTNTNVDYIKRVIGLPGDRIQVKAGQLFINGEAIKREAAPDFVASNVCPIDALSPGQTRHVKAFKETMPNGVSYTTLQCVENPERVTNELGPGVDHNNTREYVVPPDHYFMMGDNRDNSQDSRFLGAVGYVPAENLIGKAQLIFFSVDTPENASWGQALWLTITEPSRLRLSRFLSRP